MATLLLFGGTAITQANPFDDARAVWHLADGKDAAEDCPLKVVGAVRLGVTLDGREAEESRRRGGDGKVARFDGGYLAIDAGDGLLNLPGQTFTILLRVRDPAGRWNAPLFGSYGNKSQASYYLHALDGTKMPMADRQESGNAAPSIFKWLYGTPGGPKAIHGSASFLEFIWGAARPDAARLKRFDNFPDKNFSLYDDVSHALMRIGFPAQTMGLTDWHDLAVRLTGPKLQLFIDGVLVDEEFPVGETRQNRVPCLIGAGLEDGKIVAGFRGLIEHVAVWRRATVSHTGTTATFTCSTSCCAATGTANGITHIQHWKSITSPPRTWSPNASIRPPSRSPSSGRRGTAPALSFTPLGYIISSIPAPATIHGGLSAASSTPPAPMACILPSRRRIPS